MPATPMATSVVPWRQARPKESVTITAGATPKRAASASRSAGRRGVRVAREQHHPVVAGRVRAVDARARADEAVLGLGDDEVAAAAADGARLAQDHRDVVVGLLDPPLGLGDDLLRDDDDVARPSSPPARSSASPSSAARSSPGRTSGIPSRGTTWITPAAR